MIDGKEFSAEEKLCVALGNFDGLHLGHRALLEQSAGIAAGEGLTTCVWCFTSHPRPEEGLILSHERRLALFDKLGTQIYVHEDFLSVKELTAAEFVEKILIGKLNAAHVVCGFNYTFAKNASGNAGLLGELLGKHGVTLTVVPPVTAFGRTVSSTFVRELIADGDITRANALLVDPFTIDSPVVKGRGFGRTMGFATVNQPLDPAMALPRFGVYASVVETDGGRFRALTNVGVRPTFLEGAAPNCESALIGFSGALYGKKVKTELRKFIREEKKFGSAAELYAQIEKDAEDVRRYFEKTE